MSQPKKISTLVLIRHGQSQWNKENLFTGWKDPDLTEKGIEEAINAGQKIKQTKKFFRNIKFWLFDLDNTLYDGATKVFDQVDKKMSKFISEKLKVNIEEA